MGKALYESDDPAFRDAMDRCASAYDNAVAAAHGGSPPPAHQGLLDLLGYRGSSNVTSTIDNTRFAQPAILALGFSLAEMWRSRGVEPSIVLGHSIGEIAAACVAGAFTIEAAMRLTVARGIAMSAIDNTQSDGVMVAARVAPSEVRTAVEAVVKRMGSVVSIAAANGPRSVVISGSRAAVAAVIQDELGIDEQQTRALKVSHAFHSPLVAAAEDPVRSTFEAIKADGLVGPTTLPVASTVSGMIEPSGSNAFANADHWIYQITGCVLFDQAMEALCTTAPAVNFLEVSFGCEWGLHLLPTRMPFFFFTFDCSAARHSDFSNTHDHRSRPSCHA